MLLFTSDSMCLEHSPQVLESAWLYCDLSRRFEIFISTPFCLSLYFDDAGCWMKFFKRNYFLFLVYI